jgi:hypothetical protein
MVLIDFESTNVWRAFFLNSLATTIAIAASIIMKLKLEKYVDKNGDPVTETTSTISIIITIMTTFLASFGSYVLLKELFNFGGGMLVNQ